MPKGYVLSEADVKALRDLISQSRQHLRGHSGRSIRALEDDLQTPDVYIAKSPVGGIPAAVGIAPGSAECDIYRVVDGSLVSVDGLTKTVYNLTGSAIAANSWLLVMRDKFEVWVAVTGGSGGGSLTVESPYGTPFVDEVTTIQYDGTDGFSGSSSGPGIFRFEFLPASTTQAGIVSLTSQTMGDGNKYFLDRVGIGTIVPETSLHVAGTWVDSSYEVGILVKSNPEFSSSNSCFLGGGGLYFEPDMVNGYPDSETYAIMANAGIVCMRFVLPPVPESLTTPAVYDASVSSFGIQMRSATGTGTSSKTLYFYPTQVAAMGGLGVGFGIKSSNVGETQLDFFADVATSVSVADFKNGGGADGSLVLAINGTRGATGTLTDGTVVLGGIVVSIPSPPAGLPTAMWGQPLSTKTTPLSRKPYTGEMAPITTRHLLYHVYPRPNSAWRWNILWLRERLGLFNGTKTVAVAFDGTTEHPDLVRNALNGTGCEIIPVGNNPNLREVATFLPLYERVSENIGPGEVTLWAHAKGVSHPLGPTVEHWTKALYTTYMDYWPVVEKVLGKYPLAGSFKRIVNSWVKNSLSDWHYSGSWLWFRNAALFGKPDWQYIDQFWSGIESYPSLHFTPEEAGVLFYEDPMSQSDLYRYDYWSQVVAPALEQWQQDHQHQRTVHAPA